MTRLLRRRSAGERGASLVEFALLAPLFFMLILGMFTGGQAYSSNLSISNGAREAARNAATLPTTNFAEMEEWLDAVAETALRASTGEVNQGAPDRLICVAFVHPAGSNPRDRTSVRRETDSAPTYSFTATDNCFDDGRGDTERRVQVMIQRSRRLEFLVAGMTVTLDGRSVMRFEPQPAPSS